MSGNDIRSFCRRRLRPQEDPRLYPPVNGGLPCSWLSAVRAAAAPRRGAPLKCHRRWLPPAIFLMARGRVTPAAEGGSLPLRRVAIVLVMEF